VETLQSQFNSLRKLIKSYQKFAEQHLEVAEEIRIDQTVEGALDQKNYAFDLGGISIVKDFGLKRPKVRLMRSSSARPSSTCLPTPLSHPPRWSSR